MKKIAIGFMMAGLTLGCGKKYERPPTTYEQKIAKLDEKEARWGALKSKVKSYSLGYTRPGYFVDVDIIGGKVHCRRKVQIGMETVKEYGDEINTHEWGDTPGHTIDEIFAECRKTVKRNPEAQFSYSWGDDLIWCEGNFGIEGLQNGIRSLGIDRPRCDEP